MSIFSVEEITELGLPKNDEEIDALVEQCWANENGIYGGTDSGGYDVPSVYCSCSFCSQQINGTCAVPVPLTNSSDVTLCV